MLLFVLLLLLNLQYFLPLLLSVIQVSLLSLVFEHLSILVRDQTHSHRCLPYYWSHVDASLFVLVNLHHKQRYYWWDHSVTRYRSFLRSDFSRLLHLLLLYQTQFPQAHGSMFLSHLYKYPVHVTLPILVHGSCLALSSIISVDSLRTSHTHRTSCYLHFLVL